MYELGTLSFTRPLQRFVRRHDDVAQFDQPIEPCTSPRRRRCDDADPSTTASREGDFGRSSAAYRSLRNSVAEPQMPLPIRTRDADVGRNKPAIDPARQRHECSDSRMCSRLNRSVPTDVRAVVPALELSDSLRATASTAGKSAADRKLATCDSSECRLTVELSGARADVWAWHFISHASAPAIC